MRGVVAACTAALAALVLAGCGITGDATTRIDEAEVEIVEVADAIVEAVGLEVRREVELGQREQCTLVTQNPGGSNRIGRYGPLPEIDDPLGRASAVLVEHGYELREEDLDDGIFGRRDGIRITVVADRATDEFAIDADTGCRPPPD